MNRLQKQSVGFLLIFLIICVMAASHAQALVWRPILTGSVYAVAVTPSAVPGAPTVVFAAAANLMKSTDKGATWTQVMAGRASSLSADPATPGTVYATFNTLTSAGLYKTTDWGATWNLINSNIRRVVVVSLTDSNLVFGDNQKSINGGVTWQTMAGLSAYVTQMKATNDPANPGFMLAMTGSTVYQSVNAGDTWTISTNLGGDTIEPDPVDIRYRYGGD